MGRGAEFREWVKGELIFREADRGLWGLTSYPNLVKPAWPALGQGKEWK